MSTTPPTPSPEATRPLPACGRRTILRAVGLVALGGGTTAILAACGADTSAQPPTSPSAAQSPSAAEESGSAAGTKVPTADVPVGGGVIIEAKYVVTQPAEGEFKVFSAICTHQGNPVGQVSDQQIICPFHNSHFSITDGSVISGPAQTALPAIPFTTSGADIVITG
jgi:nitrite reductase/ring-hydroxylating ferredoxin subunit